jgi:hypothetical protein
MTVKNADGSLVRVPLSNISDLTAKVFWATYGTTTSAQINAADSAGKIVMCKRTGSVYLMVFNEENYAIFTCVDSDSKTVYSLICNESTWSNSSLAIPYPSSATPQALGTAAAGSSSDYSRADHVHAKPSASDVGAEPAITEVTVSTAGAVTQALDAGKIYHFTGAVTSLSLTLNAASGRLAQYHFDFDSGSTAATVTLTGVTWPDGSFTPEANKHYEVDILNGYGVYLSW